MNTFSVWGRHKNICNTFHYLRIVRGNSLSKPHTQRIIWQIIKLRSWSVFETMDKGDTSADPMSDSAIELRESDLVASPRSPDRSRSPNRSHDPLPGQQEADGNERPPSGLVRQRVDNVSVLILALFILLFLPCFYICISYKFFSAWVVDFICWYIFS